MSDAGQGGWNNELGIGDVEPFPADVRRKITLINADFEITLAKIRGIFLRDSAGAKVYY
ncbi:MAG: hypothetical protein EPGJADBJ_00240 [Saprospiraceae bacterium]|nr:hypothetical protein [Saprospiraceae bacterium]